MLRRPTLADVKAIARLANDRRIAENTRRLPHPYSQDHAIAFVRGSANDNRGTVFLIENNFAPIGVVGIDWREPDAPELGYWLGVEHWGQGFAHRSGARGDRFHLRGIRRRAPDVRRARRQPVVAQHPGEMRLPVERRRAASLRGAGIVDPGRSLPPLAQRLVVAEELGQFDTTRAVSAQQQSVVVPAKAGTHNHRRLLLRETVTAAFAKLILVVMGPGSRGACHRARISRDPLAWPGRR